MNAIVKPQTMNPELSVFNFGELQVRIVTREGEPWFIGADVLTVLYGSANGRGHTYKPLDPSEVCLVKRLHLGLLGGRPMKLVSESGLYKLIMRSDKPEARRFQNWVTQEVLPSIRKTGSYTAPGIAPQVRETEPVKPFKGVS